MTPDVAVPYYRGASTHVYEVSKNLTALGHHVSVVSRRLKWSQARWEIIDGFQTYRTFQGLAFEPPRSSYSGSHVDKESFTHAQRLYSWYLWSYRALQLGAELATVMSGRDIDIVIERETAFGAGAVLSSLLGVPMVLEMVGPRVSPVSLKRANRVLAYSTLMVGGRVPRGKLDIVPAGVDTEAFRPDPSERASVRRRLGLDDDFLVGYVGTFQVWHGVEALLSAAAKLAEDGIKVKILLVGPYFASAQKFAAGLGLASDSIFVGPVSYELVPAYVNACDVLCAPYDPSLSKMRTEGGIGAPLKVLEYMACEKPVVTTLVRPITDVVRDGVNGMLVPPGDVQALAEAIKDLYLTPDRARGMGREGRRTVVEGYSWGSLARMLDRVLASARDNYLGNEATSN